MTQKSFYAVAGLVFLAVGTLHLIRVLYGWDVRIHTLDMPMWVSYLAIVLAGYLAHYGLSRR